IAIMGNVELGPEAEVGGDVVVVGGAVQRDPKAIVHGSVQDVGLFWGGSTHGVEPLRQWIRTCLWYGRPLALDAGLGWAWAIAGGLLVFYVFLALLFGGGVNRCVATVQEHPGYSVLATFLTVLAVPIVTILLCVSIIGVAVVPFLFAALFAAMLFGKAVMLAWIGRPVTRWLGDGPLNHPVVSVIVGGAIVLALYTVPVIGIIVYKLLTWLGLGVVVYTLVLHSRREKPAVAAVAVGAAAAGGVSPASAAAAAAPVTPAACE